MIASTHLQDQHRQKAPLVFKPHVDEQVNLRTEKSVQNSQGKVAELNLQATATR